MNTDNISSGDIFKNYTKLCKALEIEPKKPGKSRQLQTLEIQRFLDFTKLGSGHDLVIIEVYDEPVPKSENMRNTAEYIQYAEILLMQLLLKQPDNKFVVSDSMLAKNLNMIHNDFKEYYNARIKLSTMLGVDLDTIEDFIDSTKHSYKGAIKTILRRLTNRMAILHYPVMSIIIKEYNYEDEKWENVYREATDIEKDLILEVKNEVLERPEFYGNFKRVIALKKMSEYYEEVNKELYKRFQISRAYTSHSITINHGAVGREYVNQLEELNLLPKEEIEKLKLEIKKLFSKRSNKRLVTDIFLPKIN